MTRDEWMARVCADLGAVMAEIDREPLDAKGALAIAKSGAVWLLDDGLPEPKLLGEAMGLAALLVIMGRETCLENEQKKAKAS